MFPNMEVIHKRKISYSLNKIMDNCQDLRGFKHTQTHTEILSCCKMILIGKSLACV